MGRISVTGAARAHRLAALAAALSLSVAAACQRDGAPAAVPVDLGPPDAPPGDGPDGGPEVGVPEDAEVPLDCPRPASDAAAKMGWTLVQSEGVDLHDLACVAGQVFVAGDKGTLRRRPAGEPACGGFTPLSVPTEANLLTVSFADPSYGVVAGEDPRIWETRDEGQSWTEALQCGSVVFSAYHALHLHSANRGYGAGVARDNGGGAYKIFVGKTWICPDELFPNKLFYDVFRRGDDGWVVGDTDGVIYYTDDEWTKTFIIDTGVVKPLRGVFITPATVGLAVGDDGTILRSADGQGMEWTPVSFFGHANLQDVYFWDEQRGWIVGDDGTILHTTDGGQTWAYQAAPTSARLEAVCFTSPDDGWAVGEDGTILSTHTGGS